MIIVRLMGGLGNQMFQYAVGLQLATRRKTTLKLDLNFLLDRTPRENFTYRDFDLKIFNLRPEIANSEEVRRFRRLADPASRSVLERVADKFTKRKYYLETQPAFEPAVLDLPDETYLEGFFQNERYFSDINAEVCKRFNLQPNETQLPLETRMLADKIRSHESICLHVRRGDYVNNPATNQIHGLCSLEYYKNGLEELRSRGVNSPIFIFSDDVTWCREHFKESDELTVVGDEHAGPRSSIHLWLMTLCQHFVIVNSSFSWWAAWLSESPSKIVIRPSRWFQLSELKAVDICPASWVNVSNE